MKVKGVVADSKAAPLLCVAPHSSYLDVLVLFYCTDIPSSLSRAENDKVPLISGTYFR